MYEVLEGIFVVCGFPKTIQEDNGAEVKNKHVAEMCKHGVCSMPKEEQDICKVRDK